MKWVKKWLFPVLTCLIVAGAAVLPPYISQIRDAGLLGQVHTQALAADALPVREAPELLDRLALYARWCSPSEIIPSFQSPETEYVETAERVTREALEKLADGGVLPGQAVWDLADGAARLEITSWSHILLWDPDVGIAQQEPISFWAVTGDLGRGSVWMDIDAESGLPLRLSLYDPDMAQWFPYKDPSALPELARQYFDLLGLEATRMEPDGPGSAAPWEIHYAVTGLKLCYCFSFNATMLNISLERVDPGAYSCDG